MDIHVVLIYFQPFSNFVILGVEMFAPPEDPPKRRGSSSTVQGLSFGEGCISWWRFPCGGCEPPIWKNYESNWKSSPIFGLKIKIPSLKLTASPSSLVNTINMVSFPASYVSFREGVYLKSSAVSLEVVENDVDTTKPRKPGSWTTDSKWCMMQQHVYPSIPKYVCKHTHL